MATSVQFHGMNRCYAAVPEIQGEPARFPDMFAFNNGIMTYSCWRPSPAEIAEIARTGEIWMAVRNGPQAMRTTFVGSRSNIRRDCAELGRLWARPLVKEAK